MHGTQRFRDRVQVPGYDTSAATTVLGDWTAALLTWRPQVAMFVNEATLLPVLVPFAPANTVVERFPSSLAAVLCELKIPAAAIDAEIGEMREWSLGPTTNRSVVGSMNDFAALASRRLGDDLVSLSVWLAEVPCGPLFKRHISPDREAHAMFAARE